jgi:anti-sigma B factor antagonist
MKLTTHGKGDVIIVDTSGKMTFGECTSALRAKMRELSEGGSRRFLLNMGDVTLIDSSGLGELVAAYRIVTTAGGQMKLLNVTKRVHTLLKATELCTVFETFEDETLAVDSFSVVRPPGPEPAGSGGDSHSG